MRWTPYCDHVPQLMYISGCELEHSGVRFQESEIFLVPNIQTNSVPNHLRLSGYLGILQGVKAVGAQKSLGMSGVIHAPPIHLHDVQSNSYTFIFRAVNYKQNNLQYLGVDGNSTVTNSMSCSLFRINDRFSDGQEISQILRNPDLLLPH